MVSWLFNTSNSTLYYWHWKQRSFEISILGCPKIPYVWLLCHCCCFLKIKILLISSQKKKQRKKLAVFVYSYRSTIKYTLQWASCLPHSKRWLGIWNWSHKLILELILISIPDINHFPVVLTILQVMTKKNVFKHFQVLPEGTKLLI